MKTLTSTYKVFNRDTVKSCQISGYHLLKDLVNNHKADKATVKSFTRAMSKGSSWNFNRLTVDFIRN